LSDAQPPFRRTQAGIAVDIRLAPKASRNAVTGIETLADGSCVLKVSVTAVPEKGKANKALLKLLSKSWGVAMQSLDLIRGAKDRNKTVLIDDPAGDRLEALAAWARTLE